MFNFLVNVKFSATDDTQVEETPAELKEEGTGSTSTCMIITSSVCVSRG